MNCPKCRRSVPEGKISKEIKGGFFYWCYDCGIRFWIRQDLVEIEE